MNNKRDTFIFYRSFQESMNELSSEDRLVMYESIVGYALDRTEPNLTGFPKALFRLIKPQLEANWRRYENGKKGAGHGVKGGAPERNKNAAKNKTTPRQPQDNPKTTPNKNKNKNINNIDVYSFDQFWIDYDKKVGKEESSQKWEKLSEADKLKIKEHLPGYVAATPDKQFRKDPAKYLHQKSWENEIIRNGLQIPQEKTIKKFEEITL